MIIYALVKIENETFSCQDNYTERGCTVEGMPSWGTGCPNKQDDQVKYWIFSTSVGLTNIKTAPEEYFKDVNQ